ncbi:MAG: hypothetical protein ACYTHK_11295 [Planctomycetota bacterium]
MIRTLLCLAISFALGAFAFSGEEEEAGLRARVRALAEALKKRADADKGPRLVVQFHPPTSYYLPSRTRIRPHLDLLPSIYQPPEQVGVTVDPPSAFGFDATVELIRATVEPASWESMDGVDLWNARGGLMVRHLPRVQRKITTLLDRLQKEQRRALHVRIATIAADDLELGADEIERRVQGEALDQLEFRVRSAQTALREVGEWVRYVGDYRVEIAEAARIGQPEPKRVLHGFGVQALPVLDDAGNGVRIELRLDRNRLPRPIRRVDSEHGPMELPSMEVSRLRTAFWMPLGRWTVAGGAPDCLFVVRVDRSQRP